MAIKLYIQYHKNDSGKGKFIERLIPAMREFGVKCMSSPNGCDATLGVAWFKEKTGSLPKILRIDGVHLKDYKRGQWRNKKLANNARQADLIIWQSAFCRDVGGEILGMRKRRSVTIFNGAPFYQGDLASRSDSPLMAAKWWSRRDDIRHHKRLVAHAQIAHVFWKRTGITTNIAGEVYNCREYDGRGVCYLGQLDDATLQAEMRKASMFVYVPHYDWCPNVVVEAIANRCHVICGNNGGHAEMADGYGTVLPLDEKITSLLKGNAVTPEPDIDTVVTAMQNTLALKNEATQNPQVSIRYTAEQYTKAIKELLCTG